MALDPAKPDTYTFVLKLSDRPGGMEMIAATFAHRGISLESSLGNDGALDPEGRATMMVTFSATAAKKENIRRALGRLSRVRSLNEHSLNSPNLRKTVVFRMRTEGETSSLDQNGVWLERLQSSEHDREATFMLVGQPAAVDTFLARVAATGKLLEAITAVIGL